MTEANTAIQPDDEKRPFWKIPQLAKAMQLDRHSIDDLIKSGELVAINVALKPDATRPRWRISQESLDAFVRRRQAIQSAPAPRRRKRKTSDGIVRHFR
jgi:hypothetical protein